MANGPCPLYVTFSLVKGAFLLVCASILGTLVLRKVGVAARSPSLVAGFDAVLGGHHA
eukprot:CAMPEP_0179942502 /NCGR_PEP_ID=MMETSP0983-20121128/17680_1 /TAXON_ID=483367 /ORGANISM="non described non described, Strain CCMP 2436" /LENGTH=57 /DNA_ID=CAMNT_0021849867 /DNA_START=139 /DNA_END=308 /DNA_ORIENTATION=+